MSSPELLGQTVEHLGDYRLEPLGIDLDHAAIVQPDPHDETPERPYLAIAAQSVLRGVVLLVLGGRRVGVERPTSVAAPPSAANAGFHVNEAFTGTVAVGPTAESRHRASRRRTVESRSRLHQVAGFWVPSGTGTRREEKPMSVEQTQHVLDEYLDALLGGGDFGRFFADDVRGHHGDRGRHQWPRRCA